MFGHSQRPVVSKCVPTCFPSFIVNTFPVVEAMVFQAKGLASP